MLVFGKIKLEEGGTTDKIYPNKTGKNEINVRLIKNVKNG